MAGNEKGVSVAGTDPEEDWMSAEAETRTCFLYR